MSVPPVNKLVQQANAIQADNAANNLSDSSSTSNLMNVTGGGVQAAPAAASDPGGTTVAPKAAPVAPSVMDLVAGKGKAG